MANNEACDRAGKNGAPSAPAVDALAVVGCAGRESRRSAESFSLSRRKPGAGRRISACPKPTPVQRRAVVAEATEPDLVQLGRAFFAYFLCTSKESEVPAGAQTGNARYSR
ncbi:MAG: hypothetical protein ACOY3E_14225 [Pseudomonadota bacterium]